MTMPKREGFAEGPHVLGAVTLLARLVQDALTPRLTEFGLSFAGAVAMVRLWQSPTGSLPQSVLIEKLAVSRASGSLVLSELEQKGFVQRLMDPGDGRRQIVELTPRGREIEPDVHDAFEDLEGRLFHPIGSDSWKTTHRSLRAAIEALVAERNGTGS
jgi:DNA-binding MarR family transcriptional regulator